MSGPVEIDVEARRVRVDGGEWRPWRREDYLAFNDGWASARCGLFVESRGSEHYREFYDCGVAAARVVQGTGGEAA